MSSITKNWTEEDFRKELRRLDDYVKRTQGIDLAGSELEITFSTRAKSRLGTYYYNAKMFKFSLLFFNSDVPESCAIDVIRHEYAHYYAEAVFGYRGGHGAPFKSACRIVGANPSTYYSRSFEDAARKKEELDNKRYESKVFLGQTVLHPLFREGKVISVAINKTTAMLTVDFGKHGVRIIDEVWLKQHGVL